METTNQVKEETREERLKRRKSEYNKRWRELNRERVNAYAREKYAKKMRGRKKRLELKARSENAIIAASKDLTRKLKCPECIYRCHSPKALAKHRWVTHGIPSKSRLESGRNYDRYLANKKVYEAKQREARKLHFRAYDFTKDNKQPEVEAQAPAPTTGLRDLIDRCILNLKELQERLQ